MLNGFMVYKFKLFGVLGLEIREGGYVAGAFRATIAIGVWDHASP